VSGSTKGGAPWRYSTFIERGPGPVRVVGPPVEVYFRFYTLRHRSNILTNTLNHQLLRHFFSKFSVVCPLLHRVQEETHNLYLCINILIQCMSRFGILYFNIPKLTSDSWFLQFPIFYQYFLDIWCRVQTPKPDFFFFNRPLDDYFFGLWFLTFQTSQFLLNV